MINYTLFRHFLFLLVLSLGVPLNSHEQTDLGPINTIDQETLNEFILKEVNKYRKAAKVGYLSNEHLLASAGNDHAQYMRTKEKITHYQRNKRKKTPKNRVDLYGAQFDILGENVQLNNLHLGNTATDRKAPLIHTYEQLAKELVLSWRNSPPHYANMISENFLTTYTSFSITEDGKVYACQLFGGSAYQDKYKEFNDTLDYKPTKKRKCWRCRIRPPAGSVSVLADSTIVFHYEIPRLKLHLSESRMRFYNPWRDGLAADIVLKSQYPCDTTSFFNGKTAIRGIPLKPVYKKDFGLTGLRRTYIVLGKVPDYIEEEFEVNLTVVQNKRTCSNTMYYTIPSSFHVNLPLDLGFDTSNLVQTELVYDTLVTKLLFEKSSVAVNDSSFSSLTSIINERNSMIHSVDLIGFASIEGSTENNSSLFTLRTNKLYAHLIQSGIDSSKITQHAKENFDDFRRDIRETEYDHMNELSDEALKAQLQDKSLSNQLEFILKNHRYVELRIITKKEIVKKQSGTELIAQLQKSIEKGTINKSISLQKVAFHYVLAGEITPKELTDIPIPFESKCIQLLHNNAVLKFYLDSLNPAALNDFRSDLSALLPMNERDRRINTTLAIIEFMQHSWDDPKEYFKEMKKRKFIDPVIKARILLNFCSSEDWSTFNRTGSMKPSKYYYNRVKKYIKPAKLDVYKTFDIASYYSFFDQSKFAYNLTKSKIDETDNPEDLIYFLKLIHHNNVKLPRKTYLRYFEKIRKFAGDEFCTYFNNPALNFQILDDLEVKEIYCRECAN